MLLLSSGWTQQAMPPTSPRYSIFETSLDTLEDNRFLLSRESLDQFGHQSDLERYRRLQDRDEIAGFLSLIEHLFRSFAGRFGIDDVSETARDSCGPPIRPAARSWSPVARSVNEYREGRVGLCG
jgi:hypothetical protein